MCMFKSGIILKDRVFIPDYDHHTAMLEELKIEDSRENAERLFVRAELIPKNNDIFSDIDEWSFNVDQDILPDWFVAEYEKSRMIEAVKAWAKTHIFVGVNGLRLDKTGIYYIKECKNVTVINSTVEACGNSTVEACGNSTVEAFDNSTVEAWNNSTVEACGNSTVKAFDNSTVEAFDNSTVKAWNNSTVKACGNSTVKACGNSTVEAFDNSTVKAWNNSTVKAWNNSTVEAFDNSTVEAFDNSTVKACGNSVVCKPNFSAFNTDRLILSENSTFKDCTTRTIYQSGDFKLVTVTDGKIK